MTNLVDGYASTKGLPTNSVYAPPLPSSDAHASLPESPIPLMFTGVMEEGTLHAVRDFLGKHGYVLEMEVAAIAYQHTNLVYQGITYVDTTTGTERETDVWALLLHDFQDVAPGDTHGLSLIIECKNTTDPWVLFSGLHGEGGFIRAAGGDKCRICFEYAVALERYCKTWGDAAYAITHVAAKSGKDHAYAAVRQVVSATVAHHQSQGPADDRRIPTTTVPIVVTRSPLIRCTLDANGEAVLTEVDRAVVSVPYYKVDEGGLQVLVVRLEALSDVLGDLAALAGGEWGGESEWSGVDDGRSAHGAALT